MTICPGATLALTMTLAAACVAGQDPPASRPGLESARVRYGAKNWPPPGAPRPGFDLGNWRLAKLPQFLGGELDYSIHVVVNPQDSARPIVSVGPIGRRFWSEKLGRRHVFGVEILACDSAAAAHERLLEWLATFAVREAVRMRDDEPLRTGEIGYVHHGRGDASCHPEWVLFVRGSVAARIHSLRAQPAVDLRQIAHELDAAILATAAIDQQLTLTVEAPAVVAVGEEPVVTATTDPKANVRWVLGGPGQGQAQIERDAEGKDRWRLRATAAGVLCLTAVATNSLGRSTSTSKLIKVEPAPR